MMVKIVSTENLEHFPEMIGIANDETTDSHFEEYLDSLDPKNRKFVNLKTKTKQNKPFNGTFKKPKDKK